VSMLNGPIDGRRASWALSAKLSDGPSPNGQALIRRHLLESAEGLQPGVLWDSRNSTSPSFAILGDKSERDWGTLRETRLKE
jgi:hypothetical protein